MTLKGAALLALVGVSLAAILLVIVFIQDVLAAVRGLIPAARLLASLIYAFAAVTAAVFLYKFFKTQA